MEARDEITIHTAIKSLMKTFKYMNIEDDSGVCIGLTNTALCFALARRASKSNIAYPVGDIETLFKLFHFITSISSNDKDIQHKINDAQIKQKRKQNLTNEERMYLEIPALLLEIDIFFQPQVYAKAFPMLFQRNQLPHSQQAEKVFFLLQPHSLVPKELDKDQFEQSGIIKAGEFTGIYNENQLQSYCAILQAMVGKAMATHQNNSVVITLKISNHAIMLAYENGKWMIFNPNFTNKNIESSENVKPYYVVADADDMATKIIKSFSPSKSLAVENAFSTEFYVADKSVEKSIKDGIEKLNENKDWKQMHEVNLKNAIRPSSNGTNWLTIAAKSGDVAMLNKLMKDPAYKPRVDILFIALNRGHEAFALKLLEKPESIDFEFKLKTKTGRKGMFQVAEERNLYRVMIRCVRYQADNEKIVNPKIAAMVDNILDVLQRYFDKKNTVNERREKSIHSILEIISELTKNGRDENINVAQEQILDIVKSIELDHSERTIKLFGVIEVTSSTLAKELRETLNQIPSPSLKQ